MCKTINNLPVSLTAHYPFISTLKRKCFWWATIYKIFTQSFIFLNNSILNLISVIPRPLCYTETLNFKTILNRVIKQGEAKIAFNPSVKFSIVCTIFSN